MQKQTPLTVAQREAIYQMKLNGQTLSQIARQIGCSYETVRKWWRAGHAQGIQGLCHSRRTRPKQKALCTFDERIAQYALAFKRGHPRRGPIAILHQLRKEEALAGLSFPGRSTLAAFFQEACPELLAGRRPRPPAPPRSQAVHQIWQIDSKEGLHLGDGTRATVFDIREPVACLWLGLTAHATQTPKGFRKLTLAEVQGDLRLAFCQHGLPDGIQSDREHLYGQPANEAFPTTFTLWLTGLGITHHFSRAATPTDQPQVERGHRTWHDWLFTPQPFGNLQSLQAGLDESRWIHSAELPSQAGDCAGRPPLVAHPEVMRVRRPYAIGIEPELFSLARVDAFLAQYTWPYKVTPGGQVFIHGYSYYLGVAAAGRMVEVRFAPADRHFVFTLAESVEILRRLPARGLSATDLTGLTEPLPSLERPIQLSFSF